MAGIDEAGRGCLAGPVVAAAVILPNNFYLPGLTDSKKLTPVRRERLSIEIRRHADDWSLGIVWPGVIDAVNILQATFIAMSKAASTLRTTPDFLLIDGNQIIPSIHIERQWRGKPNLRPPAQMAIVRGDLLEPAISAASILAKTYRDSLMASLSRRYPGYGFEKHKGYGTKMHYAALERLGPCKMHRLTFRGVSGGTKYRANAVFPSS